MTLLYFAGAEAHWHRFHRLKVPYAMFTFFKMHDDTSTVPPMLPGVMECKAIGMKCVLDSGAHTFQSNPQRSHTTPMEYKKNYFRFLDYWHQEFDWVVELDIDHLVGFDEVKRWRKELKDRGIDNFIPVWHGSHSEKDWQNLLNGDYKYVGTQTKLKLVGENVLWGHLRQAGNAGVRVHGFGMSSARPICLYFDSLDSTSWYRLPKYGTLDWFTGGKKQTWVNTKLNRIGAEGLLNLDSFSQYDTSLKLWMKYQTYLAEMGKGTKGFT